MKFVVREKQWRPIPDSVIKQELAPGPYLLVFDNQTLEFVLEEAAPIKLPPKIYGELVADAEFYLNAYKQEKNNLGIALNGEKGGGKTMLAMLIGQMSGLPVIRIERSFSGSKFTSFINNLNFDCVIIIDEYDKHYEASRRIDDEDTSSAQTALLQLLDGGVASHKLFILTSNENRLSTYMVNRPSRIKYLQSFQLLNSAECMELLHDKLNNQEFIPDFLETIDMQFGVNFDTLYHLINEVNRLNVPASIAIKRMNIHPDNILCSAVLYKDNKIGISKSLFTYNSESRYLLESMHFYESSEDQDIGPNSPRVLFDYSISSYEKSLSKEGLVFTHKKHGYKIVVRPEKKTF